MVDLKKKNLSILSLPGVTIYLVIKNRYKGIKNMKEKYYNISKLHFKIYILINDCNVIVLNWNNISSQTPTSWEIVKTFEL
ncbi:hypothetical protein BpHYR1_014286 [Brachionus plicatilis]|uniref:Uncharacterized protein n=1 Tax=Brachionus plicatilis TaxID=10195 RepID=A0A3M7R649_BRAPC|nr:hypothetical protein BpHYR1_014286 [Brachionus plicatilis]